MTAGELKRLLKDVPDDYEVGYTKSFICNDNWYGESISNTFTKIDFDINVNINNKRVSLYNE